jgi:hypothetical protein
VQEKELKDMINSPRTLEACKRLGINLADLDTVTEDQVRERILERERKRSVPQVLVEMRMKHYADKRKERITMIKEVRFILPFQLGY